MDAETRKLLQDIVDSEHTRENEPELMAEALNCLASDITTPRLYELIQAGVGRLERKIVEIDKEIIECQQSITLDLLGFFIDDRPKIVS